MLNFGSREFYPCAIAMGGSIRRAVHGDPAFVLRIVKLIGPGISHSSLLRRAWNDQLHEKAALMLNSVIIYSFSVSNTPSAHERDASTFYHSFSKLFCESINCL